MSAPPTAKLGKYRIESILGRGAMGEVYKAFDPSIARHVALKSIRKDLLDGDAAEQTIARFSNEAMAAGRLNHPGIIAIYEYGEDGDTAFIAMEFAEGQGLREYLRARGAVKLADIAQLMAQLLDALEYAHQRGVVHRDIKPANIIITGEGKLKITDFGIARLDASNLTQTGIIVGTPSYMAPEQYAGTGLDHRADLFSAGVMLYEMLTGVKPFAGTSQAIAYQICHTPHAAPSSIDPALPVALDAVIDKALAKNKEQRYASAAEFSRALAGAVGGSEAPGADATVINTAVRPATGGADTASMPAGWSPEALKALEGELIPLIGPMARTIVKRGAAKSADASALIEILVNSLDGAEDRKRFAAKARVILDQTALEGTIGNSNAETIVARRQIPDQELALATSRLAPYLGPIAKVLVKRAAARSADTAALYAELAGHLSDAVEKSRFLKEAGIK